MAGPEAATMMARNAFGEDRISAEVVAEHLRLAFLWLVECLPGYVLNSDVLRDCLKRRHVAAASAKLVKDLERLDDLSLPTDP